jgi:PAS domain S-box-containing protein
VEGGALEKDLEQRKHIAQLEELVKNRTASLTEAQAQLEHAILERKRAEAEQERLLATERAQTRRQAALLRLSAELAATLDEAEVCRRVVRGLKETLGHAIVALFFLDEITGDRIMTAHVSYEEDEVGLPTRIKPGKGLSELPLLDGQLHYTPDVSQEPRYFPGVSGSEVDVPVRIGGKVLGVLSAENAEKNAFNQDDFEVLMAAAHQAGLAIEKARLLAAERQRADELDALRTTMADITSQLELASLLKSIVERATGLLEATGGELGLYDETSQEVHIVVSHNLGEGYLGTRHRIGEGAMGRVAETRTPLIIEDYLTWEARAPRYANTQIHAILAVPLMVGTRLVGVVTIVTTNLARQFSPTDLHLLSLFAQQAAIAIENARLYDQAQREISERNKLEEEIRRQKEYFEALFIHNPVAAATVDLDAKVVSWNPMAEKLFGYSQEEAIGQNLDSLVANDPRVREEALDYSNQIFRDGRIQATTKRTRKDGSLVDVEIMALPVNVSGELVGYIAIYHDISELQLARRTAEAANQAKSTFLANMSHELRTPLNAILGFTQLMDRDLNLTTEQQENLAIINRSGEHLLALINDVLEMSKIEAGRVTLQEKSFDLYRLLDILEEMFRLRAEEKGLALSFGRSQNMPQYVCTDEGKVRQVLMNLLGNAVKFTETGSVASWVTMGMDEQHLIFEVKDTGPGIAPGEIEAMFEPFLQTASGQRTSEGTGLGLSISRQFARLMGGDITVSSELGKGSVFRFEVPVRLAEAAKVDLAQSSRQVLGLAPGQATYRLLIVDDRETTRQLLVRLLEPLGFEVREATNGQEAFKTWERWEPHLIWMDMRMPVMDGYEATRRIKSTTKGQATVIVALTASAFEEDRETILAAGCDDVVRKPFRKQEIFDKLSDHLGVSFIYGEADQLNTAASAGIQNGLAATDMENLPPGWLSDLQQATIRANLGLILTLADQIRVHNSTLADALASLAQDFEYKKILTFIEQAGGER